jgi:hypothetical protein
MKWIVLTLAAVVVAAGPAGAQAQPTLYRASPSADVALPFWCDWGYDWEERCWRDFSDRLSVGGDEDKVWRSALRLPLDGIPHGSVVLDATLSLSFDGVCLAPRKTDRPCPARNYTIDVHPIVGGDWLREREVEIGPLSPGRGSGPERRNGSPGMSRIWSSSGSNPARPTTVCC